MNEQERAEFEHHKKAAEEQLNRMYYGKGGKARNGGRLSMPSFLASPQQPKGKEKGGNEPTPKQEPKEKRENTQANSIQNTSNKSGSFGSGILNLLNFKSLKMDNDRLIILAICLLLAGEETDELLMLALMYIML